MIGPSTLRNQGASKVNEAAIEYLSSLNLKEFSVDKEADFLAQLDKHTEILRTKLPKGAQNWGTARKALNLFLLQSFYDKYLSKKFDLDKIEYFLEVPLDKDVATSLQQADKDKIILKKWKSIKSLTSDQSDTFQKVAALYASRWKPPMAKAHLDMIFWRANYGK